jgi:hypothetical protein
MNERLIGKGGQGKEQTEEGGGIQTHVASGNESTTSSEPD